MTNQWWILWPIRPPWNLQKYQDLLGSGSGCHTVTLSLPASSWNQALGLATVPTSRRACWPSSLSQMKWPVDIRWLFHPEFPNFGKKLTIFAMTYSNLQDRLVSIIKDRSSTSILFYWANCPHPKKCHSLTHPLIRAQPSDSKAKPWTTPPNRRCAWPPEYPGVESAPPPDGGAKWVI
jgi:hypothetical protein